MTLLFESCSLWYMSGVLHCGWDDWRMHGYLIAVQTNFIFVRERVQVYIGANMCTHLEFRNTMSTSANYWGRVQMKEGGYWYKLTREESTNQWRLILVQTNEGEYKLMMANTCTNQWGLVQIHKGEYEYKLMRASTSANQCGWLLDLVTIMVLAVEGSASPLKKMDKTDKHCSILLKKVVLCQDKGKVD